MAESCRKSLAAHIQAISANQGIPLSTLKLNAKILVDLRLIKEAMDLLHGFRTGLEEN